MFFSVVIPLYNKAPYVSKCLESVLAQTFTDFEVIVVDDGSSDDGCQIAESFNSRFSHFVLHYQPNSGVSVARNTGVSLASSDYICFLDADDWWDKDYLLRMSELIAKYPDAVLWGSAYIKVKGSRTWQFPLLPKDFHSGYIDYFDVYSRFLAMPVWTGAAVVRRKDLISIGGFKPNLKLGEDFDLWVRLALKGKVAFLNTPLAYYNQDVDVASRGIGRLIDPQFHILWNIDYLSEYEKTNPTIRLLLDNMRTYSLFPYYLSDKYRDEAKHELSKVDWSGQPSNVKRLYSRPLWFLKLRQRLLVLGSYVKKKLKNHFQIT